MQKEEKDFSTLGILLMIFAVLLPVILFVGILDNFNERQPATTFFVTLLIGIIAGLTLVRFHVRANWQWAVWVAVAFALYGLALIYMV